MPKAKPTFTDRLTPYRRLVIETDKSPEDVKGILHQLAYGYGDKSVSYDVTKPYIGDINDSKFRLRTSGVDTLPNIINGEIQPLRKGSKVNITIRYRRQFMILSATSFIASILPTSHLETSWYVKGAVSSLAGLSIAAIFLVVCIMLPAFDQREARFWKCILNEDDDRIMQKMIIDRIPVARRHYSLVK